MLRGAADALNPYELSWMVVLIAAISYLGYFAVGIVGEGAGIPLTGLLAGLASSTAPAMSSSRPSVCWWVGTGGLALWVGPPLVVASATALAMVWPYQQPPTLPNLMP